MHAVTVIPGLLVAAVGVAVAVNPVTVVGWNSAPISVQPGQIVMDSVRVAPKGRHSVVLQSSVAGASRWRAAWKAKTTKRGRVTVRFPTDTEGEWDFRLKVRGAAKPTTAPRRIVVRGTAPDPVVPTPPTIPPPTSAPSTPSPASTTIYVAGDIGLCPASGGKPDKTAAQVDAPVIAPGDLAYPNGTTSDFASCYDPYWGSLRDSTYPVPGNHEYNSGASAYFAYFGDRVGTLAQPWYSLDLGGWRFYMLNSNCTAAGGCRVGSPQYTWLTRQLAQQQPRCTAVVWHHPRWSSGQHGPYTGVSDLYALLAANGADLLLTGHEHNYERFAAMSAAGALDPAGIRQFVVGTGGQTMRSFASTAAGSQMRLNDSTGVLRMKLTADGYSWEFLPTTAGAGADTGSDLCH
jgi:acid phosphatase type 7